MNPSLVAILAIGLVIVVAVLLPPLRVPKVRDPWVLAIAAFVVLATVGTLGVIVFDAVFYMPNGCDRTVPTYNLCNL